MIERPQAVDAGGREPAPALRRELEGPGWMFPWRIGDRIAPLLSEGLPAVHATRTDLIREPVRAALAAAGPGARALDLACCEGWFSHLLLDWGAERVVGLDVRELNVRRAELVRDHLGVPAERLEFRQGDVLDLDPRALGRFDVVLCLGLVYHLERPFDALRLAGRLGPALCVVEGQVTRQGRPVVWVSGAQARTEPASFAAHVETDFEDNQLASQGGVVSLIPNRAAMELMARVGGFTRHEILQPPAAQDPQFLRGDRVVMLARP